MLTTLISAAALTFAPAEAHAAAPTDHGKLPWFEGTWEEVLAEATKTNKLVFVDFWTDW